MNAPLLIAGALAAAGGLAHSYMGERMILIPLLSVEGIPGSPFGGSNFTRRVIRFAWHFFTVVVWSTAAFFLLLGGGALDGGDWTVTRVLAGYWAVFAAVVLVLSRGHHFAWALGAGVAAGAWLGTV